MIDEQSYQNILVNTGAVVIGRNEGDRLKQCLSSLLNNIRHIIYVDSGSTDGSVEMAKRLGVQVVALDMERPFTAARARNEGLNTLSKENAALEYVQFVDGDCEVQPEWIPKAIEFLEVNEEYAAACGRRRERYPDMTIYNLLCDIEWDTPIGEAKACGGDALFRFSALKSVDGYKESLIAGEEPEMCYRMRQLGWKIIRLDAEMTLHDAAMTRFNQWWKRNQRAGHAYAESYSLHGNEAENFRKKETRSIVVWAVLIPLIIVVVSIFNEDFLFLWMLYPLQILRLAFQYRSKLNSIYLGLIYATSNVLGKWPQFMGLVAFLTNYANNKQGTLIEYK